MNDRTSRNGWIGSDRIGDEEIFGGFRASSHERSVEPDRAQPVGWMIRWSLYASVFALLFEALPLGLPVELTKVTGAALVLSSLSQPRLFLRKPPLPMLCFLAYLYICGAIVLLQGFRNAVTVLPTLFVLTQLLVFFWIAYCIMRDESVARSTLLALVASCVLLSILQALGMTTTTAEAMSRSERISVYGLDPNQLAGLLSLGLIAVLGLTYGLQRSVIRPAILVWPVFALIGLTVVKTGSRGGMISLAAGLIVLMLGRGSVGVRARNVSIVLLGVAFFLIASYRSEITRQRFEKTIASGNMTGRERIYPASWAMFLERPLLGWGPYTNTYEIQNRVRLPGYPRITAHNLVLYVLTATGLFGAIPFFLGTGLCVWGAWRGRNGPHGILPFAMIVAVLMADMSVDGIYWKQHWFVLAYALASGTWLVSRSRSAGSGEVDTSGPSLALDTPGDWDLNLSHSRRMLALDPPRSSGLPGSSGTRRH